MNRHLTNEKEIIILFIQGDKPSFEKLYYFYSKRLLGFLIKLVKCENLAADLLQDIFIKIWNNRENIDPDKSFRSYLFRIAESLVFDFYRKASRDKKLEKAIISNLPLHYNYVEEDLNTREKLQILQKSIEALPSRRKQVFQLVKVEGFSYDEVSTLLNISSSTINDHIVKATKLIRKNLDQYHTWEIVFLFVLLPS